NEESQPWWQVDLGNLSTIEEIIIYNRTDKLQQRLNNFYVFISATPFDENQSLQDLIDDNNVENQFFSGNAGLQENFNFSNTGRYVRIQLSGTNQTLHMAEIQIIGCQGGSIDPCAGAPQATIVAVGPFEENDGIKSLQASPSGGNWGGDALANGTFDTNQEPGTYTVTYSFIDGNGCSSEDSLDIVINAA
ncbi:discoidin domain-containing protein, partial [Croceitalea sp. P059]